MVRAVNPLKTEVKHNMVAQTWALKDLMLKLWTNPYQNYKMVKANMKNNNRIVILWDLGARRYNLTRNLLHSLILKTLDHLKSLSMNKQWLTTACLHPRQYWRVKQQSIQIRKMKVTYSLPKRRIYNNLMTLSLKTTWSWKILKKRCNLSRRICDAK